MSDVVVAWRLLQKILPTAIGAHLHLLVPVTVASLSKSLKADGAGVWALTGMGSHVVEDITKFREFLVTGEALEDLVLAPCRRVDRLGPLVSFLFYYLLA